MKEKEMHGFKVEINELEWVIVHAADAAEAERIGWEHYTVNVMKYPKESIWEVRGDADGPVTPLPQIDSCDLTMRRLIGYGLADQDGCEDFLDPDLDQPKQAIYLTTEY